MNPITRLIRFVLDRTSAQKASADAKRSLGGVEQALGGLKRAAAAAGAAIAAALGVRAMIRFADESVRAAAEAEQAWLDLAGTIDAAGESSEEMIEELRLAGAAFQDATRHSDEEYAQSLTRLITITGDVAASTANMGLVANVAAQFYGGQLGPAVELVSKVMNGNLTLLQRMGIRARSAQEALEILAERSFGAAERQANTFSGRLARLNNLWGEFKEQLGSVLVGSGTTRGAIDVLIGVVRQLLSWVDRNRDALRAWADRGIRFAITGLDALIRTLLGLGEIFTGAWMTGFGLFLQGWAKFAGVMIDVVEIMTAVPRLFGVFFTGGADPIGRWTARLHAATEGIQEWARAVRTVGMDTVREGVGRFTQPLFTFDGVGTGGGGVSSGTPRVSKNRTESDEEKRRRLEAIENRYNNTLERQREDSLAWFEETRRLQDARLEHANRVNEEIIAGQEAESKAWVQLQEEMAASIDIAGELGMAVAGALGGDIGPAAAAKAQQNLIEAAELGVRAIVAAINPFTAWQAPLYASAAAKHLALAGAWKALSAAAGGGGRGSTSVSGAGGGGAGSGATLGAARGASQQAASRAEPRDEIHLHLVGPGFDALNPEVQRIVYGAQQEARRRYGQNAAVRIHRSRTEPNA